MSEVAKSRGISVPNDLDIQVSNMFTKAAIMTRQANNWMKKTKGVLNRDISSNSVSILVFMTVLHRLYNNTHCWHE